MSEKEKLSQELPIETIKMLWRFMKYEWIEIDAYSSWEKLVEYVEKVLKGFGDRKAACQRHDQLRWLPKADRYVINFA